MDETEIIMNRINELEENMKEYVSMCRMNCGTKIESVEQIAEKAHSRLDDHKKSIECLTKHKNISIGITSVIIFILTWLGFKEFNILK